MNPVHRFLLIDVLLGLLALATFYGYREEQTISTLALFCIVVIVLLFALARTYKVARRGRRKRIENQYKDVV